MKRASSLRLLGLVACVSSSDLHRRTPDSKAPIINQQTTIVKHTVVEYQSVNLVPTTTSTLTGIRNKFITLPCTASGITFDLKYPAAGLNIPTQASNTKKLQRTDVRSLR